MDSIPTVDMAAQALADGQPLVVLAPEPFFMAAAQGISAQTINLMARAGRGLICHAMPAAQIAALELPFLPQRNHSAEAWAFAASFEAAEGCSSGISAADRALTLNAAASGIADRIVTPGHIMPVLGHLQGAASHAPSLALRLLAEAGCLKGGAAICTILGATGAVATPEEALFIAQREGVRVLALPQGAQTLPAQ